MSQPFLGELRMFGFGFPPKGWAVCGGQLLAISTNQALFSILGTTYGGDGIRTFALPNMQGRAPAHRGNQLAQGAVVGQEMHTLLGTEIPQHTHIASGSTTAATLLGPVGSLLGTVTAAQNVYINNPAANTLLALNAATIGTTGGSQPHENRQPYSVTNMCIALVGAFPSRN